MSEYIEREALKEMFSSENKPLETAICSVIDAVPAADVAPVEVIRKVLKDWLSDERYCTREWSAWSYGTMTQDDFVPIDVDEIVDDILETAKMDGGEKHE